YSRPSRPRHGRLAAGRQVTAPAFSGAVPRVALGDGPRAITPAPRVTGSLTSCSRPCTTRSTRRPPTPLDVPPCSVHCLTAERDVACAVSPTAPPSRG